jgi:Flp pilus assembly protein TadG
MKKPDSRGVAALEFCIVAAPLFTLMFAIFDLGRYAITLQSLRMLASAEAREMMIKCYTPAVISSQLPTTCTADYLSGSDKQTDAPFLYAGGLTPTLSIACAVGSGVTPAPTGCAVKSNIPLPANGTLTVTASQPNFTMLMPIWGTSLNAPSASTSIAF